MSDLKGRVALVTGAARGIGAATAKALAAKGAKVLVTDILDGAETASAVGGAYFRHDVTSEDEWIAAVAEARKQFGGLDILVNNAGVFWMKPIVETSLEDFRRMQQINVEGVFLGFKHAIPAIAERAQQWDGGGAIVNLSSVAGLVGSALTCAYNASKGAVRLMTKSAAMECAAAGLKIRVNSVHPGVIDTLMAKQVLDGFGAAGGMGDNEARQNVVARHPLGHLGRDSDVANAIAFLASDDAAFITGTELAVDGGFTAN
jgi:NAD(P)-dependent dehydrogenase (short-subunit alcohol dehydrogenase family)